MKTLKAVREEIQNLFDEVEAVLAVATKEQRELTKDEQARIDVINGVGDDTGELGKLKAEEARLQKVEDMRKEIAANRAAENRLFVRELNEELEPQARKIVVPATAKRHFNSKAFDCIEDAYATGQYIAGAIFNRETSMQWCREHGILNAHSTGDNSKGGYLVPEVMETAVIRLVEGRGVFRRNTRLYPMASGSATVPRRSAGFTHYWVGENSEITKSDLTLGQIKLEAKKLGILTQISSELDESAVAAMAQLVVEEIAYAAANAEDQAGFNGDGTSTYGGIVGLKSALAAGSVYDAIAGNDSAAELDLQDFELCVAKLPQFDGIMPKWYMHSAVYWAAVARLQDAAGGNTVMDLGNGPVRQLLGYPVEFVQVMPSTTGTLASTIIAYFGDLAMASTMGTTRGLTISTDSSRYFELDAIAVKATQRLDINVHERGDADTAGPMIGLKTAS